MKLLELFDTTDVFPYKQETPSRAVIELPGGASAPVLLGYNIGFHITERQRKLTQQEVATLFNTISEVVSEWMTTNQPRAFKIIPADKARERIYRIMVNKIMKRHPEYNVEELPTGRVTGWEMTRGAE